MQVGPLWGRKNCYYDCMIQKWVIGVDEAGRGPLAGPVSVGVVLVPSDFDWELIPGVNDSKKLSAGKREEIFVRALELVAVGKVRYSVQMPTAKAIDKKGIAVVIRAAMAKGLAEVVSRRPDLRETEKMPRRGLNESKNKLYSEGGLASLKSSRRDLELDPGTVMVKLDGSLYAPAEYVHQETIIKGDAKERVIGLASIMAKVTRDRYMCRIATKPAYQKYNFARHKGYGTAVHRAAIAQHGLSPEHRVTYCRNIRFVV